MEEVEGEEVKQHTRGCSTQKHRPGTSTLQGARSRTGNGPGGEVAYSLREELRRGGCDACERGQAFEEFQIQFDCKILSPNYITSCVRHAFGTGRVVGYLPCVNGRATGRASRAAALQRRRMSADDADPLAGLSLKERELLQYLEDLQRNNPAEYDMIAKQIQEGGANLGDTLGNGSKAGKKPPAPKGEMVTPEPGFVAKTHSFTHQARKTFINLCKSDHVDPPAQVEVPGGDLSLLLALSDLRRLATAVLRARRVLCLSLPHPHPRPHLSASPPPLAGKPDECQMRIPLSLGPPREDLDKEGEVCCVYDVVFHSETIEAALNDKDFRGFVLQLAAHQVRPPSSAPSSASSSAPSSAPATSPSARARARASASFRRSPDPSPRIRSDQGEARRRAVGGLQVPQARQQLQGPRAAAAAHAQEGR